MNISRSGVAAVKNYTRHVVLKEETTRARKMA